MQRTCVAIVDATRARLFMYERWSDPEGLHEQITESTDLVNPARHRPPHELFSDSGTTRAGDDHRDAHIDHMDEEFARAAIAEIVRAVGMTSCHRLVLCAGPRMLGTLRKLGTGLRRDGLVVSELAGDLVKLTAAQLRDHLAADGLLPPPLPRPQLDHRPRVE